MSPPTLEMYRSVNASTKKQVNDRFIPRRLSVNFDLDDNHNPPQHPDPDLERSQAEFVNYAKVRYNYNNYQTALRSILMPMDTRVLNFFSPKKFKQTKTQSDQIWPVKARKKPVIGPPEIILDMPDFDSNIGHHVADWGSNNCLATIFEYEVHMWYPNSESLRSTTSTRNLAQNCVKWRQEGTQFAVGLFPDRFGVWDIASKKLISHTICCGCCEVYSMEWIDACLITGCSRGVLKMFTAHLKCVKTVAMAHNAAIINVVASCNKKFVATSSLDKTVIVWRVPELEGHFQITFSSVVRALAWHPWKWALLATGLGFDEGRVVIWNVNGNKQVGAEMRSYKNSSVDCVTFNPISGELVASYFVAERRDSKGCGIVAVLANIDKVVEELHIHNGPIPYLLWGCGGKVLASVSADENLCIWDFFGYLDYKKDRKVVKKRTENSFGNLNYIRSNIR